MFGSSAGDSQHRSQWGAPLTVHRGHRRFPVRHRSLSVMLQRFAIGLVPAWMLAMPFTSHAPTMTLELRTYKKVSSTKLADVGDRALRLAATGSALDSLHSGDEFFELMSRGTPAVLVDNSTTQLLIVSISIRIALAEKGVQTGGRVNDTLVIAATGTKEGRNSFEEHALWCQRKSRTARLIRSLGSSTDVVQRLTCRRPAPSFADSGCLR